MFLLVPLGDRLPHRSPIVALLGLTGMALLAASAARALPDLLAASALIGVTTIAAQIIAPMAGLAADARRGVTLGTLLSGSIHRRHPAGPHVRRDGPAVGELLDCAKATARVALMSARRIS